MFDDLRMNHIDITGKIGSELPDRRILGIQPPMSRSATPESAYVTPGMPPLDTAGSPVSYFEFWPIWLIYAPVAIQWLLLGAYYRSFSLPLIANPNIPSAGMVGFSKADFLAQAEPNSQKWILPWVTHQVSSEGLPEQIDQVMSAMADKGLSLPIVAKPDMGCRGIGIKLINTEAEMHDYVCHYPVGSTLMLQRLADWEPEAGIFYVRQPNQDKGRVISMALKYTPYVVGDGVSTLRELLNADPRAGQVMHLYESRHHAKMDDVIADGEPFRLVFAASHCRGAVFRDGRHYITDALSEKIEEVMSGFPEFYYGRLDIKFHSIERLMQGEDFAIIEVNGASSESLHIWDKKAGLGEAWSALLGQYYTLFKIGNMNRQRGHQPPGIMSLIKAWRHEQSLSNHYPATD